MLHGKTVIELHNNRTHRDERIVHHNMLTNYIRDYFALPFNTHTMRRYCNPIYRDTFFNGLMMFSSPLSNDADDYWFPNPATARMVAHGDNATYSGADTTRGSFNSSQSSVSDGNVTKVWDFTQEQGNGTIASLGLCSAYMAKIGSGAPLISNNATDKATYSGHGAVTYYDIGNNRLVDMDYTNGIVYYMIAGGSGKINILKKYALGFAKYPTLRCNVTSAGTGESDYYNYSILPSAGETVQVDLSSVIGSASPIAASVSDDGFIYLLGMQGNWSNGNSRTLVKMNVRTGEYTTQSVTNNTGKTICLPSNVSDVLLVGAFGVYDGKAYFAATDGNVVYIDLSDNTNCGLTLTAAGASVGIETPSNYLRRFHRIGNMLVVTTSTNSPSSEVYTCNFFVLSGSLALYLGLYAMGSSSYGSSCVMFGKTNTKARGIMEGAAYQTHADYIKDLPCLTTKNNLESAVTKTADMTMRVTYTVTDQAE